MRTLTRWWCTALLVTITNTADASDIWVIRGLAEIRPEMCSEVLRWNADAVLHNLSGADRLVTVVDTSNGGTRRGTVFVGAGRSRALSLDPDLPDRAPAEIWVTKLDVPDGVQVEGRLEYIFDDCHSRRPPNTWAAGAVALPVFDHLTVPNQPQIHFGTDLGVQTARYNVGIYNAADVRATATVEVTHPACLGDTKLTRTFSIPPHTLMQESLFGIGPWCEGELNDVGVSPWVTYTTVTVDQPSLSYVVSLAGAERPQVTLGVGMQ